jgi:hypothetical protein
LGAGGKYDFLGVQPEELENMEIVRRIFVVLTWLWLGLMLMAVCVEVNGEADRKYAACMGPNFYATNNPALASHCSAQAGYASMISVGTFLLTRNADSDLMRMFILIPIGGLWGLFYIIGWISEGSGKGNKGPRGFHD